MELYDVSGNGTEPAHDTEAGALAVASVTEGGAVAVTLTDEQFQNLVGESAFTELTLEQDIGLFAGSIATGFALASLVIITKLAIGALKRLLQRI